MYLLMANGIYPMRMGHLIFILLFFNFVLIPCSNADMESTVVLPQGVNSPNFIFGNYTGISERYNSSGLVEGLTARYHIELTGKTLSTLSADLNQLVTSLNRISEKEKLGDQISMGTLDFSANPAIEYFAPIFSYGVSKNFSIGLGIPIVHYRNDVKINVSGVNNVSALKNYLGESSFELNSALEKVEQVSANVPAQIQSILASRGYKPLRTIDFTAPGDLQISGVYRYYESDEIKLAIRPFLVIPTGRPDDPDDLVDIATGGQPAIGIYSIHDIQLLPKIVLATSFGYQANLQDTSVKRVPINSDDILPGPERKDTLRRRTGNSTFLELGSRYFISHPVTLGAFYDITFKDPDWYDGDKGWDYGSLSNDSGSQVHLVKAYLEFSTLSWYATKVFSMPFLLGYVYGNTIFAINAPQITTNQLYLRMFF